MLRIRALVALLQLLSSTLIAGAAISSKALPLVLWHGLGDRYDSDGINGVGKLYQETFPGAFFHAIRLNDDGGEDRKGTFFGNVTAQLEDVCTAIKEIPELRDGFHAIGFSQGGQFLRGYVERCNSPPVKTLATFGSQHNGIAKYQECRATDWLCHAAQPLMKANTWQPWVQANLVPAQYFRNPDELDAYLEHSNFLADINNERKLKNEEYKKRLGSLDKFIMYVFDDDTTVLPRESSWFGDLNFTSGEVTPLRERAIYKEDWLGLKGLDERGGLLFKNIKGGHMAIPQDAFRDLFKEYMGSVVPHGVLNDL